MMGLRDSRIETAAPCSIRLVGKRRDGGSRYWCLRHGADATAKYGVRARRCRAAHIPLSAIEPVEIDVSSFQGGIGLWGAVPAVYDTTRLPLDKGIHVHARRSSEDRKEIDATYPAVRLVGRALPREGLLITALDAIYYMVSSIFGFRMRLVRCAHCGSPHLDKDWFSVHPHQRHLCAKCGQTFRDDVKGVGNPIEGIRTAFGARRRKARSPKRAVALRQGDYPGGIQIWGSNEALIWTGRADEEAGIHLHAFRTPKCEPDIDETYSSVTIDGVKLNAQMVRFLMAQNSMPHLWGRVQALCCGNCGIDAFDQGSSAYSPRALRACQRCGEAVRSKGRIRNVIANPVVAKLEQLAAWAPRTPQPTRLTDLLPECP
jgi:hypothetical protein